MSFFMNAFYIVNALIFASGIFYLIHQVGKYIRSDMYGVSE